MEKTCFSNYFIHPLAFFSKTAILEENIYSPKRKRLCHAGRSGLQPLLFSPNQSSIYALYVEETGIQRCFAGQQWGPESREYFILLQVLSGKGRIQIGQKTYPAVPNDVFLFYPGDHVCYYSDQSAPLEYTWVGFKGGDAQMLLAQTEFSHLKPMLHFPGDVPFSNDLQELYTYHGSRAVDSVRMIACPVSFFRRSARGSAKE